MAYFLEYHNRRFFHFTTSRFLLICVITNIALCIGKPILPHHRPLTTRFFDSDEEFEDPHQVSKFRHQFYHNYRDINFPDFELGEYIGRDTNFPIYEQGEKILRTSTEQDTMKSGDSEELAQMALDSIGNDNIDRFLTQQGEKILRTSAEQDTMKSADSEEFVQMALNGNDKIDRYLTEKPAIKMTPIDKYIEMIWQKFDDETIMMHAKNALPLLMRFRVSEILTPHDTFALNENNYKALDTCINKLQRFLVGEKPAIQLDDECMSVILFIDLPSNVKSQNQQAKEFADKMTKIKKILFMTDLLILQDKLIHWPLRPRTIEDAAILNDCYNSITVFLHQLSFESKPDCVDITAMMDEAKYQIEGTAADELETTQPDTKPSDEVDGVKEEISTETTTINEPESTQSSAEQEIEEEEESQPTLVPSAEVDTTEEVTPTEMVIAHGLETTQSDAEPSSVDTDGETTPSEKSLVEVELETTQPDEESLSVDTDGETTPPETSLVEVELETTQPDEEPLSVDTNGETTPSEKSLVEVELETTQPDEEPLSVDTDGETTPSEISLVEVELETTQPDAEPLSIDTDGETTPSETSVVGVDELETIQLDAEPPYFICGVGEETQTETATINSPEPNQSSTEQEIDEVEEPQPTLVPSTEVDTNEEVTPAGMAIADELKTTQPDAKPLSINADVKPILNRRARVDYDVLIDAIDDDASDDVFSLRTTEATDEAMQNSSISYDMLKPIIIGSKNTTNELSRKTEQTELLSSEDDESTISRFENNDKIEIGPSTTTSLIDNNSQSSIPEDDAIVILFNIPRVDIV